MSEYKYPSVEEIIDAIENDNTLLQLFCEGHSCAGCPLFDENGSCGTLARRKAAEILREAIIAENFFNMPKFEDGEPVNLGENLAWPSGKNFILNEIAYCIDRVELRATAGDIVCDRIVLDYGEPVKRKEKDTQEKIDDDSWMDPDDYCMRYLGWDENDCCHGLDNEARHDMIRDLLRRQRNLEVQ